MSDDRLRIVILSAHSCPMGKLGAKDTGGMSVYIHELARELGRLGHSVDVYTRVHDQRDRQVYELGDNARLIHLKVGDHEPI
ncbi:MAG: glycosyltransferase, partial [Chloroflexota bacterium]